MDDLARLRTPLLNSKITANFSPLLKKSSPTHKRTCKSVTFQVLICIMVVLGTSFPQRPTLQFTAQLFYYPIVIHIFYFKYLNFSFILPYFSLTDISILINLSHQKNLVYTIPCHTPHTFPLSPTMLCQ